MGKLKTYRYYRIAVNHGQLLNLKKGTIVVGRSGHHLPDVDWLWILEPVDK